MTGAVPLQPDPMGAGASAVAGDGLYRESGFGTHDQSAGDGDAAMPSAVGDGPATTGLHYTHTRDEREGKEYDPFEGGAEDGEEEDAPMESAGSGGYSRGSAGGDGDGDGGPDSATGGGGGGRGHASTDAGRSSGSSPSRAGAASSSVGSGQSGGEIGAVQAAIDDYGGVPGVYRIVKRIGRGAYGYVYAAKLRSGEKVAVKHIAGVRAANETMCVCVCVCGVCLYAPF